MRFIYKEEEYFDQQENIYVFLTQSSINEQTHSHEFWELSYVYENTAVNTTKDGTEEVNAGEFLLIKPGEFHSIRSKGSEFSQTAKVCNLLIRASYMDKLLEKFKDSTSMKGYSFYKMLIGPRPFLVHLKDDSHNHAKSLIWLLLDEYNVSSNGGDEIIENTLLALLTYITRFFEYHAKDITAPPSRRGDMETLMKYINVNYSKPLTLEYLAGVAHLSREYLSRAFKKQTGQNLSDYLTNVRISKAKDLLINTDESVEAISEYVGFNTISAFQKAFKKETNRSPREFRKINKD